MIEIEQQTNPSPAIPVAPATKPAARVRTLDFLRGLAVLAVLSVHASQIIPLANPLLNSFFTLGGLGVQLFFLVSAMTMCHMWHVRAGEADPVKKFYIRRFFRIAPLFWVAMLIYLLLNGVQPSYWAPNGIGAVQIFLTATFLHGFWPDSINSVVPGGWSIAVEMTFYAFFPFLIMRFKDNKNWYLYAAIGFYFANALVFKGWLSNLLALGYPTQSTTIIKNFLYLNFLNQAPVFLVGCYLYFALRENASIAKACWLGAAWLLAAAMLKTLFNIDGALFLLGYLGLALMMYLCVRYKISYWLFEAIGRNSYAIYLFHFLVLHYVAASLALKTGPFALASGYLLTVSISYAISVLSDRLLERHILKFAHSHTAS